MKNIIAISSVGLGMIFSVPALAKDAANPSTFNGPFIGAGVGYDHLNASDANVSYNFDGLALTTLAGYNIRVGQNVFLGVEGNVHYSTDKSTVNGALVKGSPEYGIGTRLGLVLNENAAVYVLGGYQHLSRKVVYGNLSFHDTAETIRFGAGVEHGLSQNISMRFDVSQSLKANIAFAGLSIDTYKANNTQATLAIVYNF